MAGPTRVTVPLAAPAGADELAPGSQEPAPRPLGPVAGTRWGVGGRRAGQLNQLDAESPAGLWLRGGWGLPGGPGSPVEGTRGAKRASGGVLARVVSAPGLWAAAALYWAVLAGGFQT